VVKWITSGEVNIILFNDDADIFNPNRSICIFFSGGWVGHHEFHMSSVVVVMWLIEYFLS
jgi:hypothetical protein